MAVRGVPFEVGEALPVGQDHLQCTLAWQTSGRQVDVDLSAVLGTNEGYLLGSVDGRLAEHARNVDTQFRECGVRHCGDTPAARGGQEGVALELNVLHTVPLVQYVFLFVNIHDGYSKISDLANIEFKVVLVHGGRTVCQVELSKDVICQGHRGVVAAIIVRNKEGTGWCVLPTKAPNDEAGLPEGAMVSLASMAKAKLEAVPTLRPEEQQLKTIVTTLVARGDYKGAIAAEEALVERLLGLQSRDARWQPVIEQELNRLEDLQKLSAAAEIAVPPAVPTGKEPLDEEGYQLVAAKQDSKAMIDFIRRIIEAFGGQVLSEGDLDGFAPWYSGERCVQSFARLVDELKSRCSWVKFPTAAAAPAVVAPAAVSAVVHPTAVFDPPAREVSVQEEVVPESVPRPAVALPEPVVEPVSAPADHEPEVVEPLAASAVAVEKVAPEPSTPSAAAPAIVAVSASIASAALSRADGPPMEPRCGSSKGGTQIRWTGEGKPPVEMDIGGRPCAALDGGIFVVPKQRGATGGVMSVTITLPDDSEKTFPDCFVYFAPGELESIEPIRGPVTGMREIRIKTNDMGAVINEVLIGGVVAEFAECFSATSSEAVVVLPAREAVCTVGVDVRSENGNSCSLDDSFNYFIPEQFGMVGERIDLSDENMTAVRREGVNGGVCIGEYPLRRFPQGRYFEVLVKDCDKSSRTICVGVTARQFEDILLGAHIREAEARKLRRAWLAGYDKAGAQFLSDGAESKIPTSSWRPVKDVKEGARLGVLWAEPEDDLTAKPELVIFQDGEEKCRLPATGQLPDRDEELFLVVDVQGSVKSVSIIEGAAPPKPPSPEPEKGDGEAAEGAEAA